MECVSVVDILVLILYFGFWGKLGKWYIGSHCTDSGLNQINLLYYIFFFFFFQAWNFLSHLPVIDVALSVKGWWDDSEGHSELSITTMTSDKRNDHRWIRLHADQEYVLQVSLQRAHVGFHKV